VEDEATLTVDGTQFSTNVAKQGGAIYSNEDIVVRNATFGSQREFSEAQGEYDAAETYYALQGGKYVLVKITASEFESGTYYTAEKIANGNMARESEA